MKMNRETDNREKNDVVIDIVLATKENTKGVGWLITDGTHAIEKECNIPYYDTVVEGDNFEEADWKDQAVVRQAKISWRDDTSIDWMERHMEMTQGFMLVGHAPALLILGEPTHERQDLTEEERRWPDLKRMQAYLISPGCGIIIKKGTWHDFPVSVGPEVTVFILNTKEVVDALQSMEEPAPMDFGDCYKVRMADKYHDRKVRFPDPRPFIEPSGVLRRSNDIAEIKKSMKYVLRHDGSFSSSSSSSSESNICSEEHSVSNFGYGKGMARVDVGEWGGVDANKVWVVPIINVEAFDSNKFGPSVQPHLNKKQPELANHGWREYGNKRGLKRLGRMFAEHGIPCTAVVSSDLVDNDEVMSLLQQFKKENSWEIGGHGANNSSAGHAGLSETQEANKILTSLNRLAIAFEGDQPKTWLTPGFSVTNSTPKLLSEAGVKTLLDFVDDDVPFKLVKDESASFESPSNPIICLPYSMETNDFSLVLTRNLSPREYAAALKSHISQLAKESARSGTPSVVCLGMHTFVAGTPASVYELDTVLNRLKSNCNVKWATAQETTECVEAGTKEFLRNGDFVTDPPIPKPPDPLNELCIHAKPSLLKLERDRVGLLLIDFQNDFLSQGGFGEKLGNDPSKLQHIIKPTKEVLSSFREASLPVIHTREGHRSNLADLTSLKAGNGTLIGCEGQNGRCMVRGEWGHDIISDLKPLPDGSETVIDKPGKGAFYQTDLELVLKSTNIDTLIVCGVTTEICVHSTVREACDRGIRCIVLEDCTASYFDEFHACGIKMVAAQGGLLGNVSDSKSVIEGLQRIRK